MDAHQILEGGDVRLHLDRFVRQGRGHALCQDHAELASKSGVALLALADGCSSSPGSELGAQILPRLLIDTLASQTSDTPDWQSARSGLIHRLEMVRRLLPAPDSAFDATLLAATVAPEQNSLSVAMMGDGLVIWKDTDGIWALIQEYADSAPPYLSFSLRGQTVVRQPRLRKYLYQPDTGAVLDMTETLNGGMVEDSYYHFTTEVRDLEWFLLASDGLQSFRPALGETLIVEQWLPKLVGFKNLHGCFVERRLKRMLKGLAADGVQPDDDISVIGFSVEDS